MSQGVIFTFNRNEVFKVTLKCVNLQVELGITGMLFICALPRQTLNLFRRCILTKNLFHLLSSPTFLEEPSLSRRTLHQWGSMKQVREDKVNSFWGRTRGGERHDAFNRMGTWSQQTDLRPGDALLTVQERKILNLILKKKKKRIS